jgi:hypothetical protein
MEKVVIVSERSKEDNDLSVLLNILFPECEILTYSTRMEAFEEHTDSFLSAPDLANKKEGE